MPTSLATSQLYAARNAGWGGSRLARSLVQGDPGPSLFAPGTVTGAAAVTKLAHAILAYGSQKRAQAYQDQIIADTQEKSDLELKALRQRTDPSYMSDYQRSEVEHRNADEARLSNPQPTPRAKVHLGETDAKFYGLGGEGDYDPDAVTAAKGRLDLARLTLAHQDAERRANDKKNSAVRYTKAQADLAQYDKDRTQAADAAEASMRASIATEVAALANPATHSGGRARSKRILQGLGAPKDYDGSKPLPQGVFDNAIKNVRLQAEAHHNALTAPGRMRARQVIQREAGTLLDEPGADPVGEQITRALQAATGQSSPDSTGR